MRVGAGVTYTRLIDELGDRLPGLAIASRTVGSLQIRNRGTVGGNLATASPAGDGLPPLYTADAVVELASARGTRRLPVAEFITGPKRTALAAGRADRRVHAARGGRPAAVRQGRHAQRDGDRRLLVQPRAVAGGAPRGDLHRLRRARRRCAAAEAEAFIEGVLDWDGLDRAAPDVAVARFGELAGQAARPIDDVRGTAAYRRHAVARARAPDARAGPGRTR